MTREKTEEPRKKGPGIRQERRTDREKQGRGDLQRDGGRKSRDQEQDREVGREGEEEGKTGTGKGTYRWREKKDREENKGTEK